MSVRRTRLQSWMSWVALAATLMAALAPTVSRTLAAQRGTGWVEVCTTEGIKRIAIAPTERSSAPVGGLPIALADHCGYCSVQGHSPCDLPVPVDDAWLLVRRHEAPRVRPPAAATPAAATVSPPIRAPPFLA